MSHTQDYLNALPTAVSRDLEEIVNSPEHRQLALTLENIGQSDKRLPIVGELTLVFENEYNDEGYEWVLGGYSSSIKIAFHDGYIAETSLDIASEKDPHYSFRNSWAGSIEELLPMARIAGATGLRKMQFYLRWHGEHVFFYVYVDGQYHAAPNAPSIEIYLPKLYGKVEVIDAENLTEGEDE